MQIKGFERLKTLCNALGIVTLGDLEKVYKANKKDGEAVVTTLERIAKEQK